MEEKQRQEINDFIKKHKITEDDFDGDHIFSWCRRFNEHIDQTNLAQFIIDTYDKPVLYLQGKIF